MIFLPIDFPIIASVEAFLSLSFGKIGWDGGRAFSLQKWNDYVDVYSEKSHDTLKWEKEEGKKSLWRVTELNMSCMTSLAMGKTV